MFEFFVLVMLAVAGLCVAAVVGFVFFLIKMVLWVVLFPVRLLFKLLWLPFGLAIGTVGLGLGALAIPLLLLLLGGVVIFGLIAAVIGLLIPAIPFVLLGLLLWSIFGGRTATA
jgi:hypothetical protein